MTGDEELQADIERALTDLAVRLGGDTDEDGPVENLTQVKDRGDLGMLLTDTANRVLGRVWLEYSGSAVLSGVEAGAGSVGVETHVRSEVVDPPEDLDDWLKGR